MNRQMRTTNDTYQGNCDGSIEQPEIDNPIEYQFDVCMHSQIDECKQPKFFFGSDPFDVNEALNTPESPFCPWCLNDLNLCIDRYHDKKCFDKSESESNSNSLIQTLDNRQDTSKLDSESNISTKNEEDKHKNGETCTKNKDKKPPSTKNVIKDFINQCITYAVKHCKQDLEFREYISSYRKKIKTVSDLRKIWFDDNPDNKKFRKLSLAFIEDNYIRWVYSSQIKQKRYFMKIRSILKSKCQLTSGKELKYLID